MTTHPFIPLYVDDYDAATSHLTPEEDGVYNRLLRLCWRTPGCSLPDDPAWIARKIRLTPQDFERLARSLLVEFFTMRRDRWIQRRLKREYDDITKKKNARKSAGKSGGEAKARNSKGKLASNATPLLEDMRASPEPYPEPSEEPPNPQRGRAEFEQAWRAYPADGKATIGEDTCWKAWRAALETVDPKALLAAVLAYAASGYAKRGSRSVRFDRWLAKGLWASQVPPETAAAAWPGPPEVRAIVLAETNEGWVRSYLDRCAWRDIPDRAIVTSSLTTAKALATEAGGALADMGVQILHERTEAA